MSSYKLVLGNKAYSSWSLRGWLIARLAGITFEEEVIFLRQADTREKILRHNPAGKVPVLIDNGTAIWDSLAIGEHLAERFPERGLWVTLPRYAEHALHALRLQRLNQCFAAMTNRVCLHNLGSCKYLG